MRKLVYIAGPISGGSHPLNYGRAADVMLELVHMGFAPICPHLTMSVPGSQHIPYETWMDVDFAWISRCDFLLRLSGDSPGADREVVFATERGIKVVSSTLELRRFV